MRNFYRDWEDDDEIKLRDIIDIAALGSATGGTIAASVMTSTVNPYSSGFWSLVAAGEIAMLMNTDTYQKFTDKLKDIDVWDKVKHWGDERLKSIHKSLRNNKDKINDILAR